MSEEKRNRMIDKIEKLLRRCGEGANASEAEVQQAMSYAQEMMEKYEIEMAEVMAAQGEKYDLGSIMEQIVRTHCKTEHHEVRILQAVALITGTRCYINPNSGVVDKNGKWSKRKLQILYGHKDDVAIAHRMYSELIVLVKALARMKVDDPHPQKRYHYCCGFGDGLYQQALELDRAKKARAKAAEQTSGTAMILRDKDQLIDQFAEGLGLRKAGKGRSGRFSDREEYGMGHKDGREYQYGEKIERNQNRRLT